MTLLIVVCVLFLDQLTKYSVVTFLETHRSLPVIGNFFYLTLVYNKGAAFGILQGQLLLFIIAACLAVVFIYLSFRNGQYKQFSLQGVALSLILGGAVGNLIDRVRCGYVIDFLDFRIWPVFNVADSAITVGAVLLGVAILRKERRKEKGE